MFIRFDVKPSQLSDAETRGAVFRFISARPLNLQPIGPIEFGAEYVGWASGCRKNGCMGHGDASYRFWGSDFDFGSQNWRNGEINLIATFGGRCFRNTGKGERIAAGFGDFDCACCGPRRAIPAAGGRRRAWPSSSSRLHRGSERQNDGGVAGQSFDRKCKRPVSGVDVFFLRPFRQFAAVCCVDLEASGLGIDLRSRYAAVSTRKKSSLT